MDKGQKALIEWAKLYLAHWPESEVKALPLLAAAGGLEDTLDIFLGGDWYADKWPGRDLVTFFSCEDDNGSISFTSTWQVSFEGATPVLSKL